MKIRVSGNSVKRRNTIITDLNDRYRDIVRSNKNQDFQIEDAFEMMIQEKPYRVMSTLTYDNKGEPMKSQRELKKVKIIIKSRKVKKKYFYTFTISNFL